MLISFEGLDNCGKTTIVGKLKKYYDGLNILTDFTREFETNIGREIKEMSKAGVLDPVLKTYLFAADRYIRTKIIVCEYSRAEEPLSPDSRDTEPGLFRQGR